MTYQSQKTSSSASRNRTIGKDFNKKNYSRKDTTGSNVQFNTRGTMNSDLHTVRDRGEYSLESLRSNLSVKEVKANGN